MHWEPLSHTVILINWQILSGRDVDYRLAYRLKTEVKLCLLTYSTDKGKERLDL